ncbi:HD-GYP domain-containing protein [Shinella sp. PSBB067]|uniref:HD-GYP domain-containing protein n=1 Tax=Shinella sp. PSBB067 TaxID=2715959 RepID=UPI00193C5043|nr:HD-GYP domain-containing protein [Shinella sp. PSBB067]QRI63134.1 HD-GYP domain-containing protein [Shinella sp. PSBB067]
MRKRIRTHQARLGMFVEEVEGHGEGKSYRRGFLIASPQELADIHKSKIISLVIDTAQGADVADDGTAARVEAALLSRFSSNEIHTARELIKETKPVIHQLFSEARLSGLPDLNRAHQVADHIVETAQTSIVAIIGVSRLKTRDETTYLHSLAVSALMVSFGRSLGLPDETIRALSVGGLLHDIGKMAVPVEILSSARKLSVRELAIIKAHPVRGHQMLRQFDELPPLVLDVCLHHHERYDGAGYPAGLEGERIPFAARLAAICDVYEAMTTIRPYKRAWSSAQTIELMLQAHGQFDPALLRRFVSMILSGETV